MDTDKLQQISGAVPPSIWLIGGTTEGLELSRQMVRRALRCVVSVTTEIAKSQYPQTLLLQVRVQQFNFETLTAFLAREQIAVILDASHPYATEISTLAMQTAAACQIPYLRFERLSIAGEHHCIERVENIAAVLSEEYLQDQRVLLTLGVKGLMQFQPWQSRSTLFARILPSEAALKTAIASGFSPDRLIALRPPISLELEIALWQQWRIERVVTKASGQAGGEDVKQQAAAQLGIPLVVVKRPRLSYPQQTSDLEDAIAFCEQALKQAAATDY